MKIILLKDVPGHGRKGEIKEINDGFAKNFFIAKKLGAVATTEIQAKVLKEKKEAESKKNKEIERTQKLKQDLEKRTFKLKVKVGEKGQVFSGVHEKDILKAINEDLGLELEKNQIDLPAVIKQIGQHQVRVKLSQGLNASLKIEIEPE